MLNLQSRFRVATTGARRATQAGMSLVELMVGIAVGMFVVAAAATLVATQLADNRRLLLELQVQQDLRATADIITRDIRRIGVTGPGRISESQAPVWEKGTEEFVDATYNAVTLTSGPTSEIQFNSTRQAGTIGPYGYKFVENLTAGTGVIKAYIPNTDAIAGSAWVDLTDADTVKITEFRLTAVDEPPVVLACPRLCALPSTPKGCWPTVTVRSITIAIKAQAKSDPSVVREIHSVARFRNDKIDFPNAPPLAGTGPACPE